MWMPKTHVASVDAARLAAHQIRPERRSIVARRWNKIAEKTINSISTMPKIFAPSNRFFQSVLLCIISPHFQFLKLKIFNPSGASPSSSCPAFSTLTPSAMVPVVILIL